MKLSFLNFWGDFEQENNFFVHFFRKYREGVEVVEPNKADTIIFTCFGNEHHYYNNCKKIFYTGENLRPNYNECDVSLTFDFDNYGEKNVRLPLWMLYIDWFNVGSYGNPNGLVPLEKINNNKFTRTSKTKFCSIINNHLKNSRDTMVEALSKYKKVDGFGKPFNNWFYGEDAKYRINSEYKFTICFENTIYPGYHTEKLFHAKVAGCIPLYYGAKEVEKDFNSKCYINLQDFNSINEYCEKIIEIDRSEDLYKKYFNEPLFNTPPSLDAYYEKIKLII